MTEPSSRDSTQDAIPDAIPQAVVDTSRRVSLVWLIPLVALLAALWLGYRAYSQQGQLISIHFTTAEGLEAGKTKVRFKDVDIGQVESIELTNDLAGVRVLARLKPQMADYLNDKARFWVVRPRLSGGQVSGLGTLVGGTYIAADFADGSVQRLDFDGLEAPPVVTANERGSAFTLVTDALGSLAEGSPVLHRGVEVGRVAGYRLRDDDKVAVQVFVQAPYDARVDAATRFWNVSGLSLSLGAEGIQLDTGSLASVLLGGVAFGNPPETEQTGKPLAQYRVFPDRQSAMARAFKQRDEWQVNFSGSVRGLVPGAPVELRGMRIGEVVGMRLRLDPEHAQVRIPVEIAIEPGRLGLAQNMDPAARRAFWDKLVANGLRAQLKTGNLLTGSLFVDLDFYPDQAPQTVDWDGPVPSLPSVPTAFDELRGLLSKLSKLPLDRMGKDLSNSLGAVGETLHATNTLLKRLDSETTTELNKTLAKTRDTLGALQQVLSPSSPLQSQANRVLRELGSAARSLRIMADYLERHPEALLRGKKDEER
jgi:paraquat-inducible protein B